MTQITLKPFQLASASQQPQQGFVLGENQQHAGNVSSDMICTSARYLRAVNAFWASYGAPNTETFWSTVEGLPPQPTILEKETVQGAGGFPIERLLLDRYATTNKKFAEPGSRDRAGLTSPIGTQSSALDETVGNESLFRFDGTSMTELNFTMSGIDDGVPAVKGSVSLSSTSMINDQPTVTHGGVDIGIAPSQLIRPTSEDKLMAWLKSSNTIEPVIYATTAGDGDATPPLISPGTSITDTDSQPSEPQATPKAAASPHLAQVASDDPTMASLFTPEPNTLPAGGYVTDLFPSQSSTKPESVSQQTLSVTQSVLPESDVIPIWLQDNSLIYWLSSPDIDQMSMLTSAKVGQEGVKEADTEQHDAIVVSCLTKEGILSSTEFSPDNGDSIPNQSSLLSWLRSPERGLSTKDTSILEYMLLNTEPSNRHNRRDSLRNRKCILPEQATDLLEDGDGAGTVATQPLGSESSDGEDCTSLVNWNPCVVPSRAASAEAEHSLPLSSGGPTQVVTPPADDVTYMDIDEVGGDEINEAEANLNPEVKAMIPTKDIARVTSGGDDNGGKLDAGGDVTGEVGLGPHLNIDTMTGARLDVGAALDGTETNEAHSSPYLKLALNDADVGALSAYSSEMSENTIVVCLERSCSHQASLSCSVSNREPPSPTSTTSLPPLKPTKVSTLLPYVHKLDLLGPGIKFRIAAKQKHKSRTTMSKQYKDWPGRVGSTSPGALKTRVRRREPKRPRIKLYTKRGV